MVEVDLDACCMVAYMSEQTSSDEHYDRLLEAGAKLGEAALTKGKFAISVVLVTRDFPRPNATQRKRLAEARLRSVQKSFTAIVTSSAIVRGLLKTLHWIVPADPLVEERIFASLEEAVPWLEKERGEKLPIVYALAKKITSEIKKKALG